MPKALVSIEPANLLEIKTQFLPLVKPNGLVLLANFRRYGFLESGLLDQLVWPRPLIFTESVIEGNTPAPSMMISASRYTSLLVMGSPFTVLMSMRGTVVLWSVRKSA